jgi:uncharacterized integral membrane protein
MQFLKTLFWVALAVVLVLFAIYNWQPVEIQLWGGLAADVKKPALVAVAFLLGFLPTFLLYRARLWSMRRRLEMMERNAAMAQMGAAATAPVPADEAAAMHGADERMTTGASVAAP